MTVIIAITMTGTNILLSQKRIFCENCRNMGVKAPSYHQPSVIHQFVWSLTVCTNPAGHRNPPPVVKASPTTDMQPDSPPRIYYKPDAIVQIHLNHHFHQLSNFQTQDTGHTLMVRIETTRIENQTLPRLLVNPRIPIPQIPMHQRRLH